MSSTLLVMTAVALATLTRADHCQWRNSLLWESDRAGASDWPPLVGASAVFTVHVGLGVSAADRATGEIQWFVAGDSFVGGCAQATEDAIVCPRASGVLLLAAANGTILASYDTDGAPVPYGAPLVANGFVFFGTTAGKLHAVAAADLSEQWVKDLISGAIVSSAALWGPHIVVGSVNGVVFKLDPLTGEVQGSYSAGVSASRGVYSGIVVDGALAYINLNVGSNNFAAVNLNTMSEAWRVTLSEGSVASVTPAVDVDNNAVYIATVDGLLVALALDDGSTQWTAQLRHDARVRGPLGVVDGYLVAVASSEGYFMGYDFHAGAQAFSLRMELSTMLSAPAFDGNDAYFAGSTILYKMSAVCDVRS